MKFDELINELDKLGFPVDQFVVVSSGALAVRGIREARDLDILVSASLWSDLEKRYPVMEEVGMKKIEFGDFIEILGGGSFFHDESIATYDQIFDTADVLDGRRFINLKLLRKFKVKMGREKDKKDVELIDKFLSGLSNSGNSTSS